MAKFNNSKNKYSNNSKFKNFIDGFKGKNFVFYIIFLSLQSLALIFNIISLFVPTELTQEGLLISCFGYPWDDYSIIFLFFILLTVLSSAIIITTIIFFLRTRKMSGIGPAFTLTVNILYLILNSKPINIGETTEKITILSGGNIALVVFSLIFSILTIAEGIVHRIIYRNSISLNKSLILPLSLNLGAAVISFLGLLLPMGFNSGNNPDLQPIEFNNSSLLGALFGPNAFSDTLVITSIIFILAFLAGLFLFRRTLNASGKNNHDKFSSAVQLSTFFYAGYSALYLLFTIIFQIVIKQTGSLEYSVEVLISYIPLIITGLICFVQSFLVGKTKEKEDKKREKPGTSKEISLIKQKMFKNLIILLVLVIGLFIAFFVSYAVKFLILKFEYGGETLEDYWRAFELLNREISDGDPLAIVVFLFIALLIINSGLFLISLCSLFSKNVSGISLTKGFIISSFISIFAIFIFSIYFSVSLKAAPSLIAKTFPLVAELSSDALKNSKVSSEVTIPFIISAILLIAEIIIRPVDKYGKYCTEIEKRLIGGATDYQPSSSDQGSKIDNGETDLDNLDSDLDNPSKVALVDDNNMTFDNCPSFTELDLRKPQYDAILAKKKATAFEDLTLPNLVKFVVDYAKNSRLHLSYTKDNIATFLAGLGATRLSILQGMSGTGKTSLPKIFLEAIYGNCEIVEVESSWRDKNELLGYYNDFSKTYSPKKFTRALYKAVLNPETVTFIVLDEMNLSRIEYYFSDFLSLMENEEGKRQIRLLNNQIFNTYDDQKHSYLGLRDNHTIMIPSNVWFIGTANRDESTFEISDKVYDRAATMNFDRRAPAVTNYGEPMKQSFVEYSALRELFDNVPSLDFSVDKCAPIAEIEKLLSPYNISFGNRIAKQIETFVRIYCACFDNPMSQLSTALETILLSKVVRKLEVKNVTNKEQLVSAFTKLGFKKCAEFINGLNEDL